MCGCCALSWSDFFDSGDGHPLGLSDSTDRGDRFLLGVVVFSDRGWLPLVGVVVFSDSVTAFLKRTFCRTLFWILTCLRGQKAA